MKHEDKYSIGEVSEISNIPIRTLRYYDDITLVVPKYRNDVSKYRYYCKEQIVTLCIIRNLRAMGFGLKEIQDIVSGNKAANLPKSLEVKLGEIMNEISHLQRKYYEGYALLERIRQGVDLLSDKDTEKMQTIQLEEIPESQMVFTRRIMERYSNHEVSIKRWVEILDLSEKLKLKSKGTIIVTYYANPLEQYLYKDMDVEFGMLIEDQKQGDSFRKYGGFTAATAIHVGNYADIIHTHIQLVQWVNQNGYQVAGEVSEQFIISPLDVNNIHEHVTKVIVPIKAVNTKKK